MQRTSSWIVAALVAVSFLTINLPVPTRGAERIKISVPGLSTAFAPLYHAQSAGYFAEEGLEVEVVAIVGAGSLQAVLARDAQFTVSPGTYQLMLYEKGQRLIGVMSMLTRNAINIVMHKDSARQKGITDKSPSPKKSGP